MRISAEFSGELIAQVDAWAAAQQRSRSQAIALLVEEALSVTSRGTGIAVRNEPPAPAQRSKRITDAYYEAEPMSKWPAVNAIVMRAIKAGRWTDEQILDAVLRLAGDRRSVTIDSLRIELDGPPVMRSTTDDRVAALQALKHRPPESTAALRARAGIEAGKQAQAMMDARASSPYNQPG